MRRPLDLLAAAAALFSVLLRRPAPVIWAAWRARAGGPGREPGPLCRRARAQRFRGSCGGGSGPSFAAARFCFAFSCFSCASASFTRRRAWAATAVAFGSRELLRLDGHSELLVAGLCRGSQLCLREAARLAWQVGHAVAYGVHPVPGLGAVVHHDLAQQLLPLSAQVCEERRILRSGLRALGQADVGRALIFFFALKAARSDPGVITAYSSGRAAGGVPRKGSFACRLGPPSAAAIAAVAPCSWDLCATCWASRTEFRSFGVPFACLLLLGPLQVWRRWVSVVFRRSSAGRPRVFCGPSAGPEGPSGVRHEPTAPLPPRRCNSRCSGRHRERDQPPLGGLAAGAGLRLGAGFHGRAVRAELDRVPALREAPPGCLRPELPSPQGGRHI